MSDFFDDLQKQARSLLWPSQFFAWQTLLLLSLFSLLIAALLEAPDDSLAVNTLTTLSWIFLTCAVWWALSKNENEIKVADYSISAWVTGAVLSTFLFVAREEPHWRWGICSWPLLSTTIKALPHFVTWELEPHWPKKKDRPMLVMTLLINLILTSWIVFYFRVQDWVENYPSLLANDFSNSAFVTDFRGNDPEQRPETQGGRLLDSTADAIYNELNNQPWYQTERWLYTRQDRLEAISQDMVKTFSAPEEQVFWRMQVPDLKRLSDEGYLLTLRANWVGPVAGAQQLQLEKTCKILPVDKVRPVPVKKDEEPPVSKSTEVRCEEKSPEARWNEIKKKVRSDE
ncbi:MAG: hypothetical protein DCF25_12925 [Leptolyngbya foveolarum]|uniref:DUF5357 domain-containing protein n=1 Tax=Leptolyngbya foveolarum TaxID=47253 RepID=A0A2W4VUE5_9CYAN|nr:MAG: hypothetical protein DCF25_12925 [Leptolyngbya foveolarum]